MRGWWKLRPNRAQQVVFWRLTILLAGAALLGTLSALGPHRLTISIVSAVAAVAHSLVLYASSKETDAFLAPQVLADFAIAGATAFVAPHLFVWALALLALMTPITTILLSPNFTRTLLGVSIPGFLTIGLLVDPPSWQFGLVMFAAGSVSGHLLFSSIAADATRASDRYSNILDDLEVIVWEAPSFDGPLSYVNPRVATMFGETVEEWLACDHWHSRVHPDDRRLVHDFESQFAHGGAPSVTYRILTADGRIVHVLELVRPFVANDGRAMLRGVIIDVTRHREAEEDLRRLSVFIDQIPLAVQIAEVFPTDGSASESHDAPGRLVMANQAARAFDECLPSLWPAISEVVASATPITDYHTAFRSNDHISPDRIITVQAFPLGRTHVGMSVEDVTDRVTAANELQALANHDALTGLPNRLNLTEQLRRATTPRSDGDPHPFAILMMDLDQFKVVNDALGHHHGDLLLIELGRRLRAAACEGCVVARLGGDEFALLMPNATIRSAFELGSEISRRFAAPINIEGVVLQSNVSIGLAMYPEHSTEPEGLMRAADAAMYRAKKSGLGIAVYAPEQTNSGGRRLKLLGDLPRAIRNGELRVHYQPRASFVTGDIEGLEALVRWNHPEFGLLGPYEFIELAEVSGLIQDLTRFVLRIAIADAAMFRSKGHDCSMAVNLSVRNLYSPDLFDDIMGPLKEFDLPFDRLRVEITESELMDDPALAMQTLNRIRDLGVRVSIDDFGTGYSSLSYLRDLPVDEIKIDQSFVATISEGDDVVVRSIIDLGHALGVEVVAEGVETIEQWDHLVRLGCDVAQGYLISRPLACDDVVRFLADRREWQDIDVDGDPIRDESVDADVLDSTLGAPVTGG